MNRHNTKFFISFLSVLFALTTISAQRKELSFDYITNNNGLTNNTVYDICQDNKGFIWFATAIGLNRFDGQNIKQYFHVPSDKHSLPTSNVVCMVYTPDSILFIGTTVTLVRYHPEVDNFERIALDNITLPTTTFALRNGYKNELLLAIGKNGAYIHNYVEKKTTKFNVDKPIYGITCDKENTYWLSSRYTIFRFDRNGKLLKTYDVSPNLFGSAISYINTDKKGKIWVGTFENGLYTFNPKTNTFEQPPICRDTKMYYVRTVEEGETPGEYWVGAESGLYILNTDKNVCTHYKQSFDNKQRTINDNAVYRVLRNKQGAFFIGTFFGGVNIINKKQIGFNAVQPEDKPDQLRGKAIGTMAKAKDGNLWIATEDAGIAIFDKDKNTFRHLQFNEKDPTSISSNNVHAMIMDGDFCWAGFFMGGLTKIDTRTGKAKRYLSKIDNPTSLNNNFVFALHNLSADSILVGTHAGVDLLNKKTETFSRFRENEFTDSHIIDIFSAPDGKVWFCTNNRGIYIYDRNENGLMTHFQEGDKSGLTSNTVISYCIDSKKQIWIGTRNGGMLRYIADQQKFEQCNPQMLNDNVIYGIVEDNKKFLWVSTNKGISRINFADSTAIHFNIKHGLAGNQHNYKSYFADNGTIYFGGVTGFTWFKPESIYIPREKPTVYFTNLRIFNEVIQPDSSGILQQQIDFTKHLTLQHNQNSFTLDFASINYFTKDLAYQYYLEGFNKTWSPLTNLTQANYTNIAPGDYVFHIRSMNMVNGLESNVRTLHITVKPPFWASWLAYLLYAAMLWGIGYYSYRHYKTRQSDKMALAIEKIEKENLKLLHQHKMNFFTYISHEFKTPLSIIIASIDMLAKKENSTENDVYQSIKRSSTRLLSLVNQLMEFRKIETDHAVIHITKGNIIDFTNQVINTYRPLLEKKNIELSIKVNCTETDIFFDFDKLEKIMTNLLTNAIKYTPTNGSIGFDLQVDNKTVKFSVKDSGNGIPDKKRDKIFEVFYSDTFSNDIVESSGIGLALTASLIKLLKGEITVDSKPQKGSTFTVSIPYTENAPTISVHTTQITEQNTNDITIETNTTEEENTETGNIEYRLVIAEDNKDLLMLLYKNFKRKYHVKCFENGKDAWEYINKKTPDILITDIMMPVMDGVELCQKVKTDVNLCHIPVVMLTAKGTKEAKLEGLQAGADAYIAKPFSMTELEVRLANILNNQKALKTRLKELAGIEGFDIPTTNHEQAFIEKMLAVIQNNMEKSELDVQFMANELNISRSNLHNKMKTLMNMNTSEFINTVRINKAKELILKDELTFSEIAYKVGYKEAAYFFRIFKKHTGNTPGEFRQNIKTKNEVKARI